MKGLLMEVETTGVATGGADRRRNGRRVADKIAQLYMTRDQLRTSREAWLASGLSYALAHPLVALAVVFAAGCLVGTISARRSG
jgi:hypothetical protein